MHEMLLAQRIIDIIEQVMDENGAEKVLVIHVCAEKMSFLFPDSLQSSFAALTENTNEEMISNCIHCGWENPRPIWGRSVKIEGIEVLDEGLKGCSRSDTRRGIDDYQRLGSQHSHRGPWPRIVDAISVFTRKVAV